MERLLINYPGFWATKEGFIIGKNKKRLKPTLTESGYYRICIKIDDCKKHIAVHRLIAEAFIPNFENKPFVNHINGIKTDNQVENLEWVTNSENMIHAHQTGLIDNYEAMKQSGLLHGGKREKRPVEQCDLNGNIIQVFESVLSALKITGIQMKGALSGRYKTAKNYVWRYQESK